MSMGMLARQGARQGHDHRHLHHHHHAGRQLHGAQQGYDYRHLHHHQHAGRQLHGAQPLPCPAPQQLQQRRTQAEERGEEERFPTF